MIDILAMGLPPACNPEREAEYIKSLKKNIESPHVGKVMVLVEEGEGVSPERWALTEHPKVKQVAHGSRAMWADYQNYLNGIAKPGQLVGLCNADIWIDNTMGKLFAWSGSWEKVFMAFSRETYAALNSADLWLWKSPLNLTNVNEPLGKWAVDGRVAAMARASGYMVFNPCKEIYVHHEHNTPHVFRPEDEVSPPWGFSYLLHLDAQPE